MGKVIFLMNVSLDGYFETRDHSFVETRTFASRVVYLGCAAR